MTLKRYVLNLIFKELNINDFKKFSNIEKIKIKKEKLKISIQSL